MQGQRRRRKVETNDTHLHVIMHKHHDCSLVAMGTTVVGCRKHSGHIREGEDRGSISLVREAHTLWSGV